MGTADDRHLRHVGMLVQRALALARVAVVPTPVDHVFLAVDAIEETVGVEVAEIPRMPPAVAPGADSGLRIAPVRPLPRRQPDRHLPDRAQGALVTIVVEDAH